MKPILSSPTPKDALIPICPQRVFSNLMLAAIFSLATSLTFIGVAVASPENSLPFTRETLISQNPDNNPLPNQVINAVRQDLSRRTRIPSRQLRITNYSQETWPNGCLGLSEPDQFCTMALVPGWRVVVSHENQTWVYRTNASGSLVKLDTIASQKNDTDKLKPVPIPSSEIPPPLTNGIVFRAISSGGITGRTSEMVLMSDGRLMRVQSGETNDSTRLVRRVSPEQLSEFQQLLKRQSLAKFDRLSYPPPSGAADFMTVTITSSVGTTRYADMVQNNLPQPLRTVINAWNQMVSTN